MTRLSVKLLMLLAAAATIVSGCDCKGDRRITQQPGEIGIIYEADGAMVTSRDAVYDFGAVFMGQKAPVKLVVKNLGNGALGLDSLEKDSGAAVSIGSSLAEPDPVFDIQFETRDVVAGDVAEFLMTFNAPQDDTQAVVDHEVKLILRGSNTVSGAETATITLKAKAVSGVCELPKVIDFGSVAKGDNYKASVELKNPSQLEATANIGDIYSSSGDHLAFAFTADSARGTVNLPPGTNRTVSIVFSPTEAKSYLAFVKMQASAQCPQYAVQLEGKGVDSVLTWTPNPLDFSYVPPGTQVTKELLFKNAGKADANLSQIKSLLADFKVIAEGAADPAKLTVPGTGEAKLVIAFKPAVLGPRTTQLTFATSLARQPNGAAQLKGYGGGPQIQVVPSPTLAFGKVAYFAGANPPSFQTRKLTVMNIGTRPAVPDPNANLHLGRNGAGQPYWEVKPLNLDSDLAELSIAVPSTTGPNKYDPVQGLEASAGKNLVDLVVKLTPVSYAVKEYEITVFSNDPSKPEVKIVVTADVVNLPPCNYEVVPTALNFGLVTPPSYRDLAFTVKNLGQNAGDICLMSNLDIASGSDPIFSLPGGPIATKELQPNESVQVLVRAWPQGTVPTGVTNATGQAQLFMSSITKPQTLVSLQAAIAAGCLTIAPDDLDFGTVQKGCNSATKTFSIYNTCSANVTINSFAMQAAAGQPAGGPDCPGTSACPEFMLVSTPGIPAGGLPVAPGAATPLTFTAKYQPIDLGSDSGAIALNVLQNGQNVTYMVTLQGKGDTVGLNTDIFTQDSKPKADILLVIDNSCSMSDEQTALATNFTSFIKYAIAAAVDYHIGVTTTDMGSSGAKGKMVGDVTNPKVLTQTTVDVETKFKAKVNLGTMGSGSEEMASVALASLTAPLITSDNVGFLRNDAALAVVAVTDAVDQSPQPATFYYNALMNVKGVKRANMFTYNVIGPFNPNPVSPCNYDSGSDDGRHAYMVSQTNGVKEEICTPDWAKSLEQLGKTAFGFRTNFFLNGTPDLTGGKAIEVKIDGNILPNVDARGSTVWTYDAVANSVNFEPMFVPEPGQTLTITYYVTCF